MKIYNIGSLNIDYVYHVEHFVEAGETIASDNMEIFPGGKGLNQSVALARAGSKVVHGGIIGKEGAFLADVLRESNVDISKLKTVDSPTGHAIIQVNPEGQNCILLFAGANHLITDEYVEDILSDAEEGDIIILQNEVNNLKSIMEYASDKGMKIAFNPSPFNDSISKLPLEKISWWFCNEIEAAGLFGDVGLEGICDRFIEKYPESNLILTLGENGSLFISKDLLVFEPIVKVETVDTTAAGDTFSGYFLSSVAFGKDPATALKIATKAASIAVSRKGAAVSIPHWNEVKI